MKYARQIMQYKCRHDLGWNGEGNLGDCVQNLAVRNIYAKANIADADLHKVNRDEIPTYDGPECKLVMQGWFGDYVGTFPLPWTDKIHPIFIGFHLNKSNNTRERFLHEEIHLRMKEYQPIGCRDRNTRDFLRSHGLDAYFSGCMTLTFDRRATEPRNGKIFIVDLRPGLKKRLPNRILKQADFSITHQYFWDKYPITKSAADKFEADAEKVLARYKNEAKLVITSRIHVAMPCVAMGIPVVFITDAPNDERFDVLRGILPVYTKHDIRFINWNPGAVDNTEMKNAIINNAIAQITGKNTHDARQKLEQVTENMQPIEFLPWYVKAFRRIFNKK